RYEDGPYDSDLSPFEDLERVPMGPEHVDTLWRMLKERFAKEIKEDKSKKDDKALLTVNDASILATAQKESINPSTVRALLDKDPKKGKTELPKNLGQETQEVIDAATGDKFNVVGFKEALDATGKEKSFIDALTAIRYRVYGLKSIK